MLIQKQALLAALNGGRTLSEAVAVSGWNWMSLARYAKLDDELRALLDDYEESAGFRLTALLDDVTSHPERYDQPLTRPSWMNAIFFRTKAVLPKYKDSYNVNLNVDARQVNVSAGDLAGMVAELGRLNAAGQLPAIEIDAE